MIPTHSMEHLLNVEYTVPAVAIKKLTIPE
jgi:hypothetical protein